MDDLEHDHEFEPSRPAAKPRQRGNYWEVTYRENFPELKSWTLTKASDLATETGKTQVQVTANKSTRAVNLTDKQFETCDFNHFTLEDSSFSQCTFVDCRFIKGDFTNVSLASANSIAAIS